MRIERRGKSERKGKAERRSKPKPPPSNEPDWSSGLESTSALPDFTDDELDQKELGKVDEHIEALFDQQPGLLRRAGERVTGRPSRSEDEKG